MNQQIRIKLVVSSADRAIAWYAGALGAEQGERHEMGGRVVVADLFAMGTALTIKDADDHDPVTEHLVLEILTDEPDLLWARLVEAGAEVVHPLADQFYGKRAGRVRDPFGVQWILTGPLAGG